MTQPTNTSPPPPPTESVDEMVANLTAKLRSLVEEREVHRNTRDRAVFRIKELDVQIDKAERMTKALIPRHRNSSKAVN